MDKPANWTATNELAGRWRRTERYAKVHEQPDTELITWNSTHHQPETTNVEANATGAYPSFHRHLVCSSKRYTQQGQGLISFQLCPWSRSFRHGTEAYD